MHMQKIKKEDLTNPNVKRRFVTYREASAMYGIGMTRLQEHAKISGSTYKLGNKVLVNTDIFEAYLEQFRVPGEYELLAKKYTVKQK